MKEQRHPEMGKEYLRTDQILSLSAIVFFAVWIIDSFLFRFSTGFTRYVPDVLRIVLFLCLEAVAVVLGYSSHESLFSKKHEEFKLIKTGVFAWVRHPLYLSILLAYLGFVFGAMSLVSLVPWFVYVLLFDRMATYEEEDLLRIFGEEYTEYKKRMPKWIPKLKR